MPLLVQARGSRGDLHRLLVPDFMPIVGQLDDVMIAALALRYAPRAGGPALLREHWPGPELSLERVIQLAYGRSGAEAATTSS